MDKLTREECVRLAKLAEETERYGDLVECTKHLVTRFKKPLKEEERVLLSVGFKNEMKKHRDVLETLNGTIENGDKDKKLRDMCAVMKSKVDKELSALSDDIQKLLDDKLIPNSENEEANIFFLKLKGDCCRYVIEVCDKGRKRDTLVSDGNKAYQKAMELADVALSPYNILRLGVALNRSVFLYEIMKDEDKACRMAQEAINLVDLDDDAIPYSDSVTVQEMVKLLEENVSMWTEGDDKK